MAITTHAELCTAVANWLARDDLTDRIPEFIRLAEAKFNRELRSSKMETRATATIDLDSDEPEFIALPGDFQTMRRLRLSSVTGKPRLAAVTQQQADMLRFSFANTPSQPAYFTVFGDEFELIPTPDNEYELEMVYRADLPALGEDQTSNWLLAAAPDAYLYGALLESAPYMRDDDRIQVWALGLSSAIDGLNRLSSEQYLMSGPVAVRFEGPVP